MTEDIEQEKGGSFDFQRYLDVVRRRHLHFLLPLLAGWLIVWAVSWILPPLYKSGTLILVERPTMPKDYVTPNVNEDLQDRLQSITQEILSRTRLLLIIDQLQLYRGGRQEMTPAEKVDRMRKDINVELVRDPQEQITSFNIYYSARDPRVAQQVCGELTKLFINANMERRQQESEDTTKFLQSQLENARATLTTQEEKVREFEAAHVGELPAQQSSNLQVLSGLQAQLVTEQDALNTAQQQRIYLQALMDQYEATRVQPQVASGRLATVPSTDQDLDRMRAELADLSSRYTDNYPDVRVLRDQIARAERQRASPAPTRKKAGKEVDGEEIAPRIMNSVQNSAMLQVESQLQANRAELQNRERSIADVKAKVDEYQARLNQEPVREQQLADLTRGYDQSKADYDDLLKKKNGSEMATSMERMKEGERFIMLDPPNLPSKPDSPNRLKFCGMGLGVGLVLGLITVLGFEMMDKRLYSDTEIAKLLPTSVLSEIPAVTTPADVRSHMRRTIVGWAMAVAVFATILAGSAISLLHT